jgi:hypothetical protein
MPPLFLQALSPPFRFYCLRLPDPSLALLLVAIGPSIANPLGLHVLLLVCQQRDTVPPGPDAGSGLRPTVNAVDGLHC